MERFSLPDDFTSLDDGELSALLEGAVAAFDTLSTSNRVSPADMTELRGLNTAVQEIRGEMSARQEAAEAAAAEIDAMAAEVRGIPVEEAAAETEEASGEGGETAAVEPVPVAPAAPEPVTASAVVVPRRPALDLSGVRRQMPSVIPKQVGPIGPEITASVDVPGYQPGQPLDMDGVTEGIIRRANALKTAGGGVGLTASYRLPFEPELIINDSSSGTEGTRAVILASDQSRLPANANGDRNLIASGGWCAPSETVYDLTSIACPEMLWDLPEIQLARGGLRYFPIPSLDVAAMTFVHTEADDIAGSTKPCFRIPCPDPIEVRCDAIGVCLESGILTQRHFPELVAWYQRNVMVAHELRIRQYLYELALAQATPVTIGATFGALSAIYAAIALQASDMVERHSLCDSINIEVTLPWWSRALMLADLARQNGRRLDEVRVSELVDLFATLGVRIQWARGLGPAVPADIGGTTPAVAWPDQIQFLIYVAGSLQAGRGGEISLGVIHDSTKFSTNDYTALFSEECVALVNRGPDLRVVTVPICADGATAAQITATCPLA